jgi:phosphomevalonate kinase
VLSGAYAVLEGAPALVTAVDRFALADSAREPTFRTPEVAAALALLAEEGALPSAEALEHPWFDAAALRGGDELAGGRKLGLGSSAAILAASLWALRGALQLGDDESARLRLLRLALAAHARAQGGGSGVDVAAAMLGGTLRVARRDGALEVRPLVLPASIVFEVWAMPSSASTAEFVRRVFAERTRVPACGAALELQCRASERAAEAAERGDAPGLVAALSDQASALGALGDAAEVPIVLPSVRALGASLGQEAAFLPSGAGGGDVSLYAGLYPSPPAFRRGAAAEGLLEVELSLGAPGASEVKEC